MRDDETTAQWVDAPTGPGRWWRRVGDSEPVLCDVTDGEGMNATRVDGVEVMYSTRPFAGVKWRRDVPAVTDETTRLRALLPKLALPWRAAVRATEGELRLGPFSLDTALAVIAAVNALPGLLDAAERAERADALLDSAGRRILNLTAERNGATERAERAERERNDLAATLETRTTEHALAMARVRELEAIIAGRTTPPTDAEIEAHAATSGGWLVKWVVGTTTQRIVGDEFGAVHGVANVQEWRDRCEVSRWIALDAEGRPCAWTTAGEVSRG